MTHSVRALLDGIVDYAGLFPPAALAMGPAVENYGRYKSHEHAWMLGRFVVPLARLDEFAVAATPHVREGSVWRLSVLAGGDAAAAAEQITVFNAGHAPLFVIDSIELKLAAPAEIGPAVSAFRQIGRVFVETPMEPDCARWLGVSRASGAAAKVRTGGVERYLIPRVRDLARFLHHCHAAGAAFKATAGLHHPIRAQYRLTYEADSDYATMHGFLNVFLAAAVAHRGGDVGAVATVLDITNRGRIVFDDDSAAVLGDRFDVDELLRVRETFALSFGSCSFEEPIADLKGMSFL